MYIENVEVLRDRCGMLINNIHNERRFSCRSQFKQTLR